MNKSSPVTESNAPLTLLNSLVAKSMPWREIAQINPFSGMPVRTIWKMWKTQQVPAKWRAHLGLPALAPAPICPDCDVVHVAGCPKAKRPRRYHDLYAMPVELLKWKLRNREKV